MAQGVPGFWVTAMQNCPDVRELVQEHDVPLLEHLADVRLSYLDGEDTVRARFGEFYCYFL
jgi:nucleosome assembly protein 1-like 1